MRFLESTLVSLLLLVPSIHAACDCNHNEDAGRWRNELKPSDRLGDLCLKGGGCYQAEKGKMCVNGDLKHCACAVESARQWESWHGDWFLWSAITCGSFSVTITSEGS